MNARLLKHASTSYGILLVSLVVFQCGGTVVLGEENIADSEHANQSPQGTNLPNVLNELMLGCSQEGAFNYLLEKHAGRRLELMFGALGTVGAEAAENYDSRYVLRLGSRSRDSWSADRIYLYFREGYLAYKCVGPNEDIDPDEVFRREIVSGLQHPPNYPGLMDKVHWGVATEYRIGRLTEEGAADSKDAAMAKANKLAKSPKVRCGIALDGFTPIRVGGQMCNVLVLFQNVGSTTLSDDVLLVGFPVGPVIVIDMSYRDRATTTGSTGYFGLYGTRVFRWPDGKQMSACRAAAFHLGPGESTFMWFHVPELQSYASIHARVFGLWGVDKGTTETTTIRIWDAESPQVTIRKADGKQ